MSLMVEAHKTVPVIQEKQGRSGRNINQLKHLFINKHQKHQKTEKRWQSQWKTFRQAAWDAKRKGPPQAPMYVAALTDNRTTHRWIIKTRQAAVAAAEACSYPLCREVIYISRASGQPSNNSSRTYRRLSTIMYIRRVIVNNVRSSVA